MQTDELRDEFLAPSRHTPSKTSHFGSVRGYSPPSINVTLISVNPP